MTISQLKEDLVEQPVLMHPGMELPVLKDAVTVVAGQEGGLYITGQRAAVPSGKSRFRDVLTGTIADF